MKRILQERQSIQLREMSYPCKKSDGYGFILEIRSTDEHGTPGNTASPAHAHLYDTNKKPVGEIEITVQKPAGPTDIVPYRCTLPDGYATRICTWAHDSNALGVNHWDYLIEAWNRRRPD